MRYFIKGIGEKLMKFANLMDCYLFDKVIEGIYNISRCFQLQRGSITSKLLVII